MRLLAVRRSRRRIGLLVAGCGGLLAAACSSASSSPPGMSAVAEDGGRDGSLLDATTGTVDAGSPEAGSTGPGDADATTTVADATSGDAGDASAQDAPAPADPSGRRVVVVMPAYNAAKTLERTYRDIPPGIS